MSRVQFEIEQDEETRSDSSLQERPHLATGMKLPRDLSGRDVILALKRLGFIEEHQVGSHVRLSRSDSRNCSKPRFYCTENVAEHPPPSPDHDRRFEGSVVILSSLDLSSVR